MPQTAQTVHRATAQHGAMGIVNGKITNVSFLKSCVVKMDRLLDHVLSAKMVKMGVTEPETVLG
jgi:F0F1-type ATP synthase epsilon subunit